MGLRTPIQLDNRFQLDLVYAEVAETEANIKRRTLPDESYQLAKDYWCGYRARRSCYRTLCHINISDIHKNFVDFVGTFMDVI